MITITCRDCGKKFSHNARGRPPVKCIVCKETSGVVIPSFSASSSKETTNIQPQENSSLKSFIENIVPELNKPVRAPIEPLGTFPIEVMVTNLGFTYRGDDQGKGLKVFKDYSAKSEKGFGQVGHETVTLYTNGEIVEQYVYQKFE